MTYRVFSKTDTNQIDGVIEFDESYVDDDTTKNKDFAIGDTVMVTREDSKHKGVVGSVVYAAYGNYRIDPFNDAYWNNPNNIAKIGMFSDSELKKVKKKPNQSTVYKGGDTQTHQRIEITKQPAPDKEVEQLRNMFSGGTKKIDAAPARLKKKV